MAAPGANGRRGSVRYVRRKPGRGVFILYETAGSRVHNPHAVELLCLTFDESLGGRIDGQLVSALLGRLELVACSRSASVTAPGITVRRLPDDPGLPALRAAWTPTPGDDLCRALEAMLADGGTACRRIVAAAAVPRLYPPCRRCVIEYRLTVAGGAGHDVQERTLYGKLFSKREKAYAVDRALRRLTVAWDAAGPFSGWTPRPLGVHDVLGMSITEAAGDGVRAALSGLSVLRPPKAASLPAPARLSIATELALAAGALARLHGSAIDADGLPLRTGADESERALQRGRLLANFLPELASRVESVAGRTAEALLGLDMAADVRPCHGSYKRSQLLYLADGQIAVFDWDSLCMADPAIDLGCFLAHLRPSALWYERSGVRTWFDEAAACWLAAYREAMSERCVRPDVVDGIIGRSQGYEAAMLLKMATRRLRRLNSPRPGELLAVLAEAERCLTKRSDASAAA